MVDSDRSKRMFHIGVLLFVAGCLVSLLLGVKTTLTCDRVAGQCAIDARGFLGIKRAHSTFPVASLVGAKVVESTGFTSKSAARHYRAIIVTASGDLDPFNNNNRQDKIEPLVSAVNAFLHSEQKSVTVADSSTGAVIVGLAFAVAGLLLMGLRFFQRNS